VLLFFPLYPRGCSCNHRFPDRLKVTATNKQTNSTSISGDFPGAISGQILNGDGSNRKASPTLIFALLPPARSALYESCRFCPRRSRTFARLIRFSLHKKTALEQRRGDLFRPRVVSHMAWSSAQRRIIVPGILQGHRNNKRPVARELTAFYKVSAITYPTSLESPPNSTNICK